MCENIEDFRREFETDLNKCYIESTKRSTLLSEDDYKFIISEVKEAQALRNSGQALSSKLYRRFKRYDLLNTGQDEKLIAKRYTDNDDIKFYVHRDQLFDIIRDTHLKTGHKRERGMEHELKKKYVNITREVINLYLRRCKACQLKKILKQSLVVQPIISKYMNSRCQVDLIDMQTEPDGLYKFILNYQDHLTKFLILRPLKTKTPREVASHLVDIFCLVGSPFILQSENGREFSNSLVKELAALWPDLKIVHGRPRHSQSQGSVERANQDVRDVLNTWVEENNNTKWSEGLKFIQSRRNRSFHMGIGRSPYEAMFGTRQINGLGDLDLPSDILNNLKSEEDLEEIVKIKENSEYQESNELTEEDLEEVGITIDKEDPVEDTETNVSKLKDKGNKVENFEDVSQLVESHVNVNLRNEMIIRNKRILDEREESHKKLKTQATKTLPEPNKRFHQLTEGTNVLVRIPDVDRGPRNVLAVVTEVNNDGLYSLSTENRTLDRLFSRNELLPADSQFISQSLDTDNSKKIPLQTAANMCEKRSGQGFLRCNCKRFCADNKCSCKQHKVKCNSKCHGSLTCKNK